MQNQEEFIECPECDGEGYHEIIGWNCSSPSSDCCGGCVTGSKTCQECNGEGEIENPDFYCC